MKSEQQKKYSHTQQGLKMLGSDSLKNRLFLFLCLIFVSLKSVSISYIFVFISYLIIPVFPIFEGEGIRNYLHVC